MFAEGGRVRLLVRAASIEQCLEAYVLFQMAWGREWGAEG